MGFKVVFIDILQVVWTLEVKGKEEWIFIKNLGLDMVEKYTVVELRLFPLTFYKLFELKRSNEGKEKPI